MAALNALQTNAQVLAALRGASGTSMNARSIPEMREFVRRMGYSVRRPFPVATPSACHGSASGRHPRVCP